MSDEELITTELKTALDACSALKTALDVASLDSRRAYETIGAELELPVVTMHLIPAGSLKGHDGKIARLRFSLIIDVYYSPNSNIDHYAIINSIRDLLQGERYGGHVWAWADEGDYQASENPDDPTRRVNIKFKSN